MTGKIRVLDSRTIDKIAAGEVVENPASVVKELIENSIDAQAGIIKVEIKNGGKSLIKVADDGVGMVKEDVMLAFKRHATSKIAHSNDLFSIQTLGFRGEALPSIAAVSWVKMLTKNSSSDSGCSIEIRGGKVVDVKDMGLPNGTTVEVKNLFYNVPARKKYLRSNTWETAAVNNVVMRYALAHPEIVFSLKNNNKTVFSSSGNGELFDVLINVFGKKTAKNMVYIQNSLNTWEVTGFISKPEETRKNRKNQCIIVNGRVVKSTNLSKAVESGYGRLLPKSNFPVFVLNIKLPPDMLDVNIHPSKTEIKIDQEKQLAEFLIQTVKNKLKNHNVLPEMETKVFKSYTSSDEHEQAEQIKATWNSKPKNQTRIVKIDEKKENNIHGDTKEKADINTFTEKFSKRIHIAEENQNYSSSKKEQTSRVEKIPDEALPEMEPVGQVFNSYIIAHSGTEMYIIDQHAAHERIIYEELKKKHDESNIGYSQQTLEPIVVELSQEEKATLLENTDYFKGIGFDIEPFGNNTFLIRGIPAAFKSSVNSRVFLDILDDIMGFEKEISPEEKILIVTSCRAAIKAGDALSLQEMKKLIKDLSQTQQPYTCPHGRPSIIKMRKYDLEKKFLRRG